MDIQHGHEHFWTTFVEDSEDGYAGFHLYRERLGQRSLVGQTIYWDATGGFVFRTFDGEDVPVEIVQAAIAEAREMIKTK
jgi:hypothetical protein